MEVFKISKPGIGVGHQTEKFKILLERRFPLRIHIIISASGMQIVKHLYTKHFFFGCVGGVFKKTRKIKRDAQK